MMFPSFSVKNEKLSTLRRPSPLSCGNLMLWGCFDGPGTLITVNGTMEKRAYISNRFDYTELPDVPTQICVKI